MSIRLRLYSDNVFLNLEKNVVEFIIKRLSFSDLIKKLWFSELLYTA